MARTGTSSVAAAAASSVLSIHVCSEESQRSAARRQRSSRSGSTVAEACCSMRAPAPHRRRTDATSQLALGPSAHGREVQPQLLVVVAQSTHLGVMLKRQVVPPAGRRSAARRPRSCARSGSRAQLPRSPPCSAGRTSSGRRQASRPATRRSRWRTSRSCGPIAFHVSNGSRGSKRMEVRDGFTGAHFGRSGGPGRSGCDDCAATVRPQRFAVRAADR